MKSFLFCLLLLLFTYSGCKKDKEEPTVDTRSTQVNDLVDRWWFPVKHNYNGIEKIPPGQIGASFGLKFRSDSTFSGFTECNGIDGIYYANDNGNVFFLSVLNANALPCRPGTGEWHDLIKNHLLASHNFLIYGDSLVFDASINDTINQLFLTWRYR